MESIKVIASKNMPSRIPIASIALSFFAMDIYRAPGWLFGAIGALWFSIVLGIVIRWGRQEEVDILNDKKETDGAKIQQRQNAANN